MVDHAHVFWSGFLKGNGNDNFQYIIFRPVIWLIRDGLSKDDTYLLKGSISSS